MAFQVTLVPDVTPDVTAAADLQGHKNKFVQVLATGVYLADVRSVAFTATYVLQTKPNSGVSCGLTSAPSIARVIAGEAIGRGQLVQPMSASGLAAIAVNVGSNQAVGVAWTAATASGDILSVKMRW